MIVKEYRPICIVTFYTEKGELVARGTNNPNSKLDDDIISVRTNRDMGADAPTFSITLVNRKPWHLWIGSNDLVVIEMLRPEISENELIPRVVFMGLVDDCRKTTAIGKDGGIQRQVTIIGRGMAKAFIRFDMGIVPEGDVVSNPGYLTANQVTLAGTETGVMMQALWDKIAKKFLTYSWSNGKSLFDIVAGNFSSRKGMILLDQSNMVNWTGSLWALMKEISEAPFYELFWEIGGMRPMLVSRPTPFDPSDWNNLPRKEITDEDVPMDEIGRSDVETYSLFSVGTKSLFTKGDPYGTHATLPIWNKEFAKKYGISRLQVPSNYVCISTEQDMQPATEMIKKLQESIFNWNIKNNSMYNGTITVKGKATYKVGERLLYTSKEQGVNLEFYIKSVSHAFTNFGSWITQLGVVRGLVAEQRFTAPWGKYTQYDGLGLMPFDPTEAKKLWIDPMTTGIPSNSARLGEIVVNGATEIMNQHTVKYVFGMDNTASMTFDCSSFTKYIYSRYANMDIGRTTSDQVSKGIAITDKNALEKGDLVLFKNTYTDAIFTHTYGASHVGIYAGNGMFIHNSSSAKTVIMSKLSDSYYVEHWLMGRRVLQDSPISGSQSPTVSRPWGGVNLTIGSKGEDVRAIQEKVGTTADGIFGMQTENAVRIWQGTHGLNNNGIVDATTWSKMFADYSGGGGNTTGTFREVPSSALDRVLGGELRNCGSTFIAAGRHYNVDPVLIAAISMHETGNGTSNLCVKYGNVGGITNGSGFRHYPSVISGIYDMASVLWSGYISKGLKTITDIQRKYAPVGAGNDPTNLNSNWISGVTRFYNMIIV